MKGNIEEFEGRKRGMQDYGVMLQSSQQHVAPCVKGLSGDWVREL